MTKCEKFGCKPRINRLGVSWCTECGKLFSFNLNHKSLNKNYLIEANKEFYENELKNNIDFQFNNTKK